MNGQQLVTETDTTGEKMPRYPKDSQIVESVKRNKARYRAITEEFAAFPYGGGATITYDMWLNAMNATEYMRDYDDTTKVLDDMTHGGFSRLVGIFGDGQPDKFFGERTDREFRRVMNAFKRGMRSDLDETLELDRFGQPNIARYMAGCRQSVSVPVDQVDAIDLATFVAPWHGNGPVTMPMFETKDKSLTYDVDGQTWAIVPYNTLWSWDQYEVLVNLCNGGYENVIRGCLGGKIEAARAAQLEIKADVIDYGKITGIQTGYTLACNVMDDRLACAVAGQDKETHIHYEPTGTTWGPTMDVYLPKEHLQKWQAMEGSNPIQLKRLRGVIFTMLVHADPPLWWKTKRQVTFTLGQIERAYWNDPKHKTTQAERDLMVSSLSLLVNTRFESKYPPKDRAKRHEHIDMDNLVHEGITLLPAQFVRGVDANGHVVDAENAAMQFYSLPPLDMDANELSEAYTVPYLDGSKEGLAALRRVESTTYDVETELAKYVRMAVDNGKATGYVAEIARITNANEYKQLETIVDTVVIAAKYRGADNEEMAEAMRQRKQAQRRLTTIRARVKKDIKRVLPVLISNERLKKRYLNVTPIFNGRGFEIRRVKARRDQKTKKLIEPPYVFEL